MNAISRKSLFSLASAFALMATAAITQAATINVPAQYHTLQAAINAAHAGDTINVAAGTYVVSTIVWSGKDLTITGAGEGKTILQGNGSNSVLQTENLTSASLLQSITFTGGSGTGGVGGGMNNTNSNLTVTICEFASNWASSFGGGMYNYSGAPTIYNCNFHDNHALADGAGLYNDGSAAIVSDSTFTANYAVDSGGGMKNRNCSPIVTNCMFQQNEAVTVAAGGVATEGGNTVITNCVFYQNQGGLGGAIYFSGVGTVTNCTLAYNISVGTRAGGSGQGGAIFCGGNQLTMPTVTNCIVWGNTQPNNPAIAGYATLSHTDTQDVIPHSNGNFSQDPLFVNAAKGNLNLQVYSPCIDRGVNSVLSSAPFLSVAGKLVDMNICRRLSGPSVDIGAYEFQSVTDVTSQVTIVPIQIVHNSNGSITETVLVFNISPVFLDGPDTLVVNPGTGYALSNRSGVTSALAPAGRPYINLTGILVPYPVTLQFAKTSGGAFSPTFQVYDGTGAR